MSLGQVRKLQGWPLGVKSMTTRHWTRSRDTRKAATEYTRMLGERIYAWLREEVEEACFTEKNSLVDAGQRSRPYPAARHGWLAQRYPAMVRSVVQHPLRVWRVAVITVFALATLGFGALDSNAQETSEQVWFDYNPGWRLSEVTRLTLDAGVRKQLGDAGPLTLVLTPAADFRVHGVKLAGGVANYLTLNEVNVDRLEIRPYQSASYVWPNNRFSLDHRIRLDERFDFDTDTWESKNSLRGRYRLRLRYRLEEHQKVQFWSLIANGELFYTFAGTQGQHQEKSRVGMGAERTFKNGRRFRFEIVWQRQGVFYDRDETVDVIYFRFRYLRSW